MASLNVVCPKCGAKSSKEGFGQEAFRVSGSTPKDLSTDPVVVKRREKAAKLRHKNQVKFI